MVLRANDELRHPSTLLPEWRESMWYCFDMPEYEMGGAIYYAYNPNAPTPFASISAYITKGWVREPNNILYSWRREVPIPDAEWDDLKVAGVAHYKRIEPLKKWTLSFHDGERFDFDVEIDLFAGNWHYIDNWHETPKYLAGDRYHRPYAAQGEMVLDGKRYALNMTGDSDHSWGPRRWEPLYKSKYIAGQCGRDWAFHAFEGVALDGGVFPYGFIWDGQRMSPISKLEICPDYDADGIQRGIVMNIVDNEDRMTRIEGQTFCSYPSERDTVWNNDCYYRFTVNGGEHEGSGILSFYWNRDYYHRVMRRASIGG
ncbi:DUF7064 domain-containing protein [Phenylobacterium sp.]|jgi:hypothetical protein|uniref:DUF7064 domain-containing protein n=1 Tax=Phenylobacterium sp. TaxID=1871053 RepID=UPI002F4241E5